MWARPPNWLGVFKHAAIALLLGTVLTGCGDRPSASATSSGSSAAVVTDAASGLLWLRCAIGQSWQEGRCAGEARTFGFMDAQAQVNRLNAELHEGIDRWRLPTIAELAALRRCDHGFAPETFTLALMAGEAPVTVPRWCAGDNTLPAIDTTRFPDTPSVKFWSGSGNEAQQTFYAVDFASAWIGLNEDDKSQHAVRPVADPPR